MSDQVSFAHVLQFTTNVKQKLQQMGSKLRGAVTTGTHVGNGAVPVEQIGATVAQIRESRHGDTPILDTPHARRWVYPTDYEWGDMVDKQDLIRMLIDPKSPYMEAGVNALGRQLDDTIIAGALGTATVGTVSGGGVTMTEALSAGNILTSAGLTAAKVAEVWKTFALQNLDMDREEMYFVISPREVEDIFDNATFSGATSPQVFTSSDFRDQRVLPNAKLPPYLGFNWIVTNRLPRAGTTTQCFAFAKSGVYLGLWNDIEVKADQRVDKGFNWQLYARMTIGATRLEQGRVIRVDVTNA